VKIIKEGSLLFTEESAHAWAGPFEGNYAKYIVWDSRCRKNLLKEEDSINNLLKNFYGANLSLAQKESDTYKALVVHAINEYATIEKPFTIYIHGTDDTSYSKNFESESDAFRFIEHLESIQPIDFYESIQPLFAFTN
jgi:hypothetical protein